MTSGEICVGKFLISYCQLWWYFWVPGDWINLHEQIYSGTECFCPVGCQSKGIFDWDFDCPE